MIAAIQNEGKFVAADLIYSFSNYLKDGGLFIPGFVNTLESGATIDMRAHKPETGGLSKEAFLQFKKGNCVRTNDPFHSFFIFGKGGDEIVNTTFNNRDTFGKNSVFDYLHDKAGILLIMDLELYYGFTFAHYVEQQLLVKYRQYESYQFNFTDLQGKTEKKEFKVYAKRKGYNPVLNSLEKPLKDAGALEKMFLNKLPVFKIDLQKAYTVIENDIKNNKAKNIIDFNLSLYLKQMVKKATR